MLKGWGLRREVWHPGGKWGDSGASLEPPPPRGCAIEADSFSGAQQDVGQTCIPGWSLRGGGSWKRGTEGSQPGEQPRPRPTRSQRTARQQEGPAGEGWGEIASLSVTVGCLECPYWFFPTLPAAPRVLGALSERPLSHSAHQLFCLGWFSQRLRFVSLGCLSQLCSTSEK